MYITGLTGVLLGDGHIENGHRNLCWGFLCDPILSPYTVQARKLEYDNDNRSHPEA